MEISKQFSSVDLVELAKDLGAFKTETKEELKDLIQKYNGEKDNFLELGNAIFSLNEHDIIEGIGYYKDGSFKIWNNKNFGIYKK